MVSDSRFETITVVHRSVSELFDLWFILAVTISQSLPRILKWRTIGHPIEGSKVQELKIMKKLKLDLSNSDYVEKNTESGVISYVQQLTTPMIEFDLNTITQSRYTVLLFLHGDEPNNNSIWDNIKSSDGGLEAKGMERLLSYCNELVICRLFESGTHVSLQMIGEVDKMDVVRGKLNDLQINKVEEQDVAEIINT